MNLGLSDLIFIVTIINIITAHVIMAVYVLLM